MFASDRQDDIYEGPFAVRRNTGRPGSTGPGHTNESKR